MKYILFFTVLALLGCKQVNLPQTEPTSNNTIAPDAAPIVMPAVAQMCPVRPQVSKDHIYVTGTAFRSDYPLTKTKDNLLNTFMTTPTVFLGDTRTIIYEFRYVDFLRVINLKCIDFIENYVETLGPDAGQIYPYNMGELTIWGAVTDGSSPRDSDWVEIASIDARNNSFVKGDGSVSFNTISVNWIKLEMTYNGYGAFGGTPAFYLSEIYFYE